LDYCDRSDLYAYGLPRGSTPNPGRLVAAVDTASDTLTLAEHGLSDGDTFMLRPEGVGVMASPLVANTKYFAVETSDDTWKVAATDGGAVINLTTAGERMVLVVPLQIPAAIRWASSMLDQFLPAHAVPLPGDPIPEVLRAVCAELAAGKLTRLMGRNSKTITTMVDDAGKLVARWGKGVPIRGENAPSAETRTNLARAATAPFRDPSGWNQNGGIG